MTHAARLALALTLTVALTGCPNGGGHTGPLTLDEFVVRVADVDCAFFDRCGLTYTYTALLLRTTVTDCRAQLGAYLDATGYAPLRDGVAAGRIVYHPDLAGACLDAFANVQCSAIGAGGTTTACAAVFEGTVAAGGSCTTSQECAHGATCSGASGTTCGACSSVAQVGEDCTTRACALGAVCQHGVCASASGVGGACDPASSATCQYGLVCNPSSGAPTMGTCATPVPGTSGMTCSVLASCATGLVCGTSGGTSTCRAPRTDGTCQRTYFGPTTDCPSGTACVLGAGSTDGACMPIPTLGQACTSVCVAPARCASTTCVVTRDNGESCASNDECLSAHCTGGVCVRPPPCTP